MEVDNYAHLSSLKLADCFEGDELDTMDVLVGSDYYWKFMTEETCHGTDGPVAAHSVFGWLLSGDIDSTCGSVNTFTHLILTNEPKCIVQDPIQKVLQKFWETESIGIIKINHEFTKKLLSHFNLNRVNMKLHSPDRRDTLSSLFIIP